MPKPKTHLWIINWIASNPNVKDIKFVDGIMVITDKDGRKFDMTEPKEITNGN